MNSKDWMKQKGINDRYISQEGLGEDESWLSAILESYRTDFAIDTPAKTMPSREEANAIAHEISPDLGKKSYYIFLDGFMSCYDWLTDEFKSNLNNLK